MIALRTDYPAGRRICDTPLIHVVDGFLEPAECTAVISSASERMTRAFVSGDHAGIQAPSRTNDVAWVRHEEHPALAERIGDFVGLPLRNAESFQVIRYAAGQSYSPHFDAFDPDTVRGRRNLRNGGQRMVSVLCYLSRVEVGGETLFPKARRLVRPVPGRMVIFHNCHPGTDCRDPLTLHGGNRVIEGEKWAFNLWFRMSERW